MKASYYRTIYQIRLIEKRYNEPSKNETENLLHGFRAHFANNIEGFSKAELISCEKMSEEEIKKEEDLF